MNVSSVLAVAAWIGVVAAPLTAHGDLHKRIAYLTKKIKRTPHRAELYFQRAELHRLHRDWPAARADFSRTRRLAPKYEEIDFHEGRLECNAGQPKIALRFLNRQLAATPDHVRSRLWRSRVFSALERLKPAMRDLDKVLEASQRVDPDLYLERARLQLRAGVRAKKVVDGIDEGVKRLGPIVSLQSFAIELLIEKREWPAALGRIDTTLPAMPLKSPWLLRRGNVLAEMGQTVEARQAFRRGLAELDAAPRLNKLQIEIRNDLRRALKKLDALAETPSEAPERDR